MVETESEALDEAERARFRDWEDGCCGLGESLSIARPLSSSFLARSSSATPFLWFWISLGRYENNESRKHVTDKVSEGAPTFVIDHSARHLKVWEQA